MVPWRGHPCRRWLPGPRHSTSCSASAKHPPSANSPAAATPARKSSSSALGDVQFAVEDVPPSDPAPWESSDVPLGRLFAAQGKMPARIVVYRRPVETRTTDARELAALINDIVVEQVASLLGVNPRDLDAGYDPDDD